MGETPRRAFDDAFALFERQVERDLERTRESRRRPKKYYAAKRLLSGGGDGRSKPAPLAI